MWIAPEWTDLLLVDLGDRVLVPARPPQREHQVTVRGQRALPVRRELAHRVVDVVVGQVGSMRCDLSAFATAPPAVLGQRLALGRLPDPAWPIGRAYTVVTCPSTLTDWLRGQDDQALAALLRARPDLATPPPADLAVLAARAGSRASVARAAEGLDTFTLAVLDALVRGGRRPGAGAGGARSSRSSGAPAATRVRAAVDVAGARSRSRGATDDGVGRAGRAGGRRAVTRPGSAGRRRRSTAWTSPALLADLPEAERRLLTALAHGSSAVGRTTRRGHGGAARARRGRRCSGCSRWACCCAGTPRPSSCRARSALALRGDSPLGTMQLDEPELRHQAASGRPLWTRRAPARRWSCCAARRMLVQLWSHRPAGRAQVGRARRPRPAQGSRASSTPTSAAPGWSRSCVFGAGLVGDSSNAHQPRVAADDPRRPVARGDPAEPVGDARRRVAGPAAAARARRHARREGQGARAAVRRPAPPAGGGRTAAGADRARGAARPGTAVSSPDDLAAVLAWRAPRRGGRLRDEIVRWTLAEATALGAGGAGRDHRGGAGAARPTARPPRRKRMADSMPDPLDHVLVQADLTVVAPGPLEPQLAIDIGQVGGRRVGGQRDGVPGDGGVRAAGAGHRADRRGAARAVPHALAHAGAAVADVPDRRRRPAARAAARRGGGVVPAVRRPGAAGGGARAPGRGVGWNCAGSRRRCWSARCRSRTCWRSCARRASRRRPRARTGRCSTCGRPGCRLPARGPAAARRSPRAAERPERLQATSCGTLRAGDAAAATRRGRTVSLASGSGASDTAATLALLREAIERESQVLIDFVDSRGRGEPARGRCRSGSAAACWRAGTTRRRGPAVPAAPDHVGVACRRAEPVHRHPTGTRARGAPWPPCPSTSPTARTSSTVASGRYWRTWTSAARARRLASGCWTR